MKQKILITGASSGIGKAIALQLDSQDVEFILTARRRKRLESLQKILRAKTTILVADLATKKGVQRVCDALKGVDVVINNAGFGDVSEFRLSNTEKNADMISVNIFALTQITQRAIIEMHKKSSGSIINIASVAGFLPGPYMAVYYATKNYVLSFTQAVAQELAHTGIRVKALCPGPVKTDFIAVANAKNTQLFKGAVSVESIAKSVQKEKKKKKTIVIPSLKFQLLLFLTRFLSRSLVSKMIARMQKIL